MTEQEQIKALAELDGWDEKLSNHAGYPLLEEMPDYLRSYDAIILLIDKQSKEILYRIVDFICVSSDTYVTAIAIMLSPPKLLSEALLRATGKWRD